MNSDEFSLAEVLAIIWKGKWLIVASTAIFALLSVILALYLPNQYRASAILAPASSSTTSSLSPLAGQLGGLASLAGVNLGGASATDKAVVAIALMKSWSFLDQFVRENNLEVDLIAAKGWNRASNTLEIDPTLYDLKRKKWIRKFDASKGEAAEPTSWELYKELSERIDVSQDKKTGLISLSVEYYSPDIAKEWVDKLVVSVNKLMQEQDRREASRSIEYLNKQVSQTSLSAMQAVFYKLIEEQTKNLMLAELSDEYALKTLSPAKIPEEKSRPRRSIICALGTVFGMSVGMFIVVFRGFARLRAVHL